MDSYSVRLFSNVPSKKNNNIFRKNNRSLQMESTGLWMCFQLELVGF